jgi:flagellar basal-body rod protein FlgB
MPLADIPILSMLRTRMQWHQERQRVLSENVANADTPKFQPRDLVPPDFSHTAPARPGVTLVRTDPGHLGGVAGGAGNAFQSEARVGAETRPTGNAVSLEDEMLKVADNQMNFQAATSLYSRSLSLLKTALR